MECGLTFVFVGGYVVVLDGSLVAFIDVYDLHIFDLCFCIMFSARDAKEASHSLITVISPPPPHPNRRHGHLDASIVILSLLK